ncbi:hypothetical protein LCGC14_0165100 [marine sediment metagenome]|uniref:Uncharacterized protein n=1 Tax=marine sediment metagenome TaxID=412755 RepID=A0A0F9XD03_9ZZZZ
MAYVPGEHTHTDVDKFLIDVHERESWHDHQSVLAHLWDLGETDEAPGYVFEGGTKLMALTDGIILCLIDGQYEYHMVNSDQIRQFIEDSE